MSSPGYTIPIRINPHTVAAIEHPCTHRYVDAGATVIDAINAALRRHVTGQLALSATVTDVQKLLGDARRQRAMTICRTEIARAYNTAHFHNLQAIARSVPDLKKIWLHSQDKAGRPGHLLASQQVPIPIAEPFRIANPETGVVEELRYPLDPQASLANTLDCGCMMKAVFPQYEGDEGYRPLRPEDLVPPGTVWINGERIR